MYRVIIIIINFEEDIKRSFQELRLDFNSPELELELELKCLELELELELKLIVSSGIGIGIGIENNGIGIELKKTELTPTLALTCWRHQMGLYSALLALCNSPVTGEFPAQWSVTRSFDVFFDLRLNKRLSKQSRRRWFETPSRSLWRNCNDKTHEYVNEMETFPRYWPFVRGIHRPQVNSPHKGQWRGAFMFSLTCTWINDWVKNREFGYLRRNHAHYDSTVMH